MRCSPISIRWPRRTPTAPTSRRWAIRSAEKLRRTQIEIINVIVPLVNYDEATQDRMNAVNVEKANTRVAEQRAKTAEAEAKANEILAASVSNDPNVLVGKCLDAAREAHISPLGCWPNTTAVPTVPAR